MSGPAPDAPHAPQSPGDLLRTFSALALQGFGGVLPIAQRTLVEERRWLTREQFVEILSIGQVLPGPNIVNLALIIGDRFFGWRGAFAALAGLLGLPLVIAVSLAALYGHFAALPLVSGALRGMAAVAAGLIIAIALKLVPSLQRNPLGVPICALVLLTTLGLVGALRWPMAYTVFILGGGACVVAWWRIGAKA